MRTLIVILLLALSGCLDDGDGGGNGGGNETGTGGPPGNGNNTDDDGTRETVERTVTWSGVYLVNGAYSPTTVRVPANSTVVLTFVNNEQNPAVSHDLDVEGLADGAVIAPGETDTITFDVGAPTTTSFFCSVGDHRDNGMEGTFIVE